MADADAKSAPIVIKKYANRRLYNTATSSYVTLDHLCRMVKEGQDFTVQDAKTGEDITRSVLTQIIVEEESKGQNLLPINFLRQLISLYGDPRQWMAPLYLEQAMQSFQQNQERMQQYFKDALGGAFPFGGLEDVGRQNMQMMERAMRMFAPFGGESPPPAPERAPEPAPQTQKNLEELQARLGDLEKQLAQLAKQRK